jgi:hypothetical protein
VGRLTSEQPSNPYYLLLSPLKKYRVHKWNQQFMHRFHQSTQYFNPFTEELQQPHLLYKLNCLASYLEVSTRAPIVLLCVLSLMRSLEADNPELHKTALSVEVLQKCQAEGQALLAPQPPRQVG